MVGPRPNSAEQRIAALLIDQRGRENLRHASLLRHLPSVRGYSILLPRGDLIGKLYQTVNRRILYPYVHHRLLRWVSRRYPYFFAIDPTQVPNVDCPVIVDDDDPEFTPDHIAMLNCDHVRVAVTPSEALRRALYAHGLKKECVVIPSGVHLQTLSRSGVEAVRRRMGKAPDDVAVGFASPTLYLAEHREYGNGTGGLRNISFLANVMERVWAEEPRAQLWLMGRPSPSVLRYARQHPQVRLLGYVPHGQVLNYYANFDIGLYPRPDDMGGRHSIKLVEYMACGLPVVSTAVAESYLVEKAGAGLLARDRDEFARAVLELACDPRRRAALGERGRAFAASYDWRHLAERYEREVFDVYARG